MSPIVKPFTISSAHWNASTDDTTTDLMTTGDPSQDRPLSFQARALSRASSFSMGLLEKLNHPMSLHLSGDDRWVSVGTLTLSTAAVPEPSSYLMMTMGLIAVGVISRRRK